MAESEVTVVLTVAHPDGQNPRTVAQGTAVELARMVYAVPSQGRVVVADFHFPEEPFGMSPEEFLEAVPAGLRLWPVAAGWAAGSGNRIGYGDNVKMATLACYEHVTAQPPSVDVAPHVLSVRLKCDYRSTAYYAAELRPDGSHRVWEAFATPSAALKYHKRNVRENEEGRHIRVVGPGGYREQFKVTCKNARKEEWDDGGQQDD